MRVAILGTRGVPAQYGGFETAVEEVGARLAAMGYDVRVYCRNRGQREGTYRGMQLVNLPALRRRSMETLSHTLLSAIREVVDSSDVAFLFNAANAPLIPLLRLRGIPVALHVDGLEWQRAKWSGTARTYYKFCERLGVAWSQALIADAKGIQDYYQTEYGATSVYLPYGAPILYPTLTPLSKLGLTPGRFHLVVARMEPENHVLEIVSGYSKSEARYPLVVVGGVPYPSPYEAGVSAVCNADPRILRLGSVWDQKLLDALYAGCLSYLHGHSVGGTNPSLLRAMGCGAPVTAYRVGFNQEVTAGHARWFTGPEEVALSLAEDEDAPSVAGKRGQSGRQHVADHYRWDDVARGYAALAEELAAAKR